MKVIGERRTPSGTCVLLLEANEDEVMKIAGHHPGAKNRPARAVPGDVVRVSELFEKLHRLHCKDNIAIAVRGLRELANDLEPLGFEIRAEIDKEDAE